MSKQQQQQQEYSRDQCTCGHSDIVHQDANGRCKSCDTAASWDKRVQPCTRYQWNGKPRKVVW